jgi:hypothetical protein
MPLPGSGSAAVCVHWRSSEFEYVCRGEAGSKKILPRTCVPVCTQWLYTVRRPPARYRPARYRVPVPGPGPQCRSAQHPAGSTPRRSATGGASGDSACFTLKRRGSASSSLSTRCRSCVLRLGAVGPAHARRCVVALTESRESATLVPLAKPRVYAVVLVAASKASLATPSGAPSSPTPRLARPNSDSVVVMGATSNYSNDCTLHRSTRASVPRPPPCARAPVRARACTWFPVAQ